MALQDQINEDMKAALRAKETVKLGALRMLRAQLKDHQIELGRELTDEDVISVLTNAAKKRKESIEMYEKSDRTDLLENEKKELEVISAYLPKQLDASEIEDIVSGIIAEVGASSVQDIGKVMGPAMKQLKGRADGKLVQEIVRKKLS